MKPGTFQTLIQTAGRPKELSQSDRDCQSLPADSGQGQQRPKADLLHAVVHRSILALLLSYSIALAQENADSTTKSPSQIEILPVLSYDTDVGFGYGAKGFFLNQFGWGESVDVLLFNTTKGERWYRIVFSYPDFELRQGTQYPFALDVVFDYDKWIKNSFFGIGNTSLFQDREQYTREPFEASITISRGFSRLMVGQAGFRFKGINNLHFSDSSRLRLLPPSQNSFRAEYYSVFLAYRYDSRESFINPSQGVVLQGELEYALRSAWTNVELGRISGTFQQYSPLPLPGTIMAFRFQGQALAGPNLPAQMLLSLGGNQSLRGSPQDRFLDRIMALLNAEARFPLIWRLGGVVGFDAGNVWHSVKEIGLDNWQSNPVAGLRLQMDTFIVRLDIGFGRDVTGFFMNFGHLF
ncbi:MAG: BamA/TamA family outer membrane protein [Ignavibacteriales bacterium]|nr:BamA/TamA family outer membrane protein [Ignavibacteriales bacterium]